jgi:hypothetical protein
MQGIIQLRKKMKIKSTAQLKSSVMQLCEQKVPVVAIPRAPHQLSKVVKPFKRKAAKQDHSSFCYALRSLGLFQAWRRGQLRRMPELSKITMVFHCLNFLGLSHEIQRIKGRMFRTLNLYKTRLKYYGHKPDYVHLQKIYRAALNKVFSPYVRRCRITTDSAIIDTVLRTKYHAEMPDYFPQIWGIHLNILANVFHHYVRAI